MFHRVYAQVLGMLILSTVGLITVLGFVVNGELRAQLTAHEKTSLSDELCDVTKSITNYAPAHACQYITTPSDDRGQDVFYVVAGNNGDAVIKTTDHPVPMKFLRSQFPSNGFYTLNYQGHPYRVLAASLQSGHVRYKVFVYTLIAQDLDTIRRVTQLMLMIGGVGLILALAVNSFVATRALRPAQRTWKAYQDSMVELSHELQTPLATASAILDTGDIGEATKRDLHSELDRASNMVQNILYLSRLRTEGPHSKTGPVAVSDVTEEVADRFVPLAKQKNIILTGNAEPGLFVNTNIESWDRLVSSLLKNVVDHAAENSTATWHLTMTDRFVRLMIQNTAEFEQDESDKSIREWEMHGYGLQIAHRLVEDMDGKLAIEHSGPLVTVVVDVPMLRVS